jgi:flagellar biosynthesis protein FliR
LQLNLDQFVVFTLVLTRVSGLVVTAPIFGGSGIPGQIRALLAFAVAVLVFPSQWGAAVDVPANLLGYLLLVGGELLVGLVLGLGVTILFSGIQLAGQIIGQLGGLSLAEVFNPGFDTDVPLLSQLFHVFALAIFVAIGGHRLVMGGLLDTFAQMPPGQAALSPTVTAGLTQLLSASFELGIRAAAPATVALLLSTMVLGIVSRTLPQLNIMSFGFGLNALATFGALSVSLGSIAWIFEQHVESALETILDLVKITNA